MVVSSEWKGNLTEISKMKSKVGGRGAVGGVSLLSFVWDAFSVFHFLFMFADNSFVKLFWNLEGFWSLCMSIIASDMSVGFVALWTIACQVRLSMGFSRQAYWSGLPCPPPRDLPGLGIKPVSPMSTCIGRWVLYTRETWEAPLESTVWQIKLISQSVWLIREPWWLRG